MLVEFFVIEHLHILISVILSHQGMKKFYFSFLLMMVVKFRKNVAAENCTNFDRLLADEVIGTARIKATLSEASFTKLRMRYSKMRTKKDFSVYKRVYNFSMFSFHSLFLIP